MNLQHVVTHALVAECAVAQAHNLESLRVRLALKLVGYEDPFLAGIARRANYRGKLHDLLRVHDSLGARRRWTHNSGVGAGHRPRDREHQQGGKRSHAGLPRCIADNIVRAMILARPMGLVRVIRPAAPFSSLSELPALRVVDLLMFELRASIARVATHLPRSTIALKMACRNSLFGSTEHAEVKDSRQVDRLLSHGPLSKNCTRPRLNANQGAMAVLAGLKGVCLAFVTRGT